MRRLTAAALAGAALMAGCGGGDGEETTTSAPGGAAAERPAAEGASAEDTALAEDLRDYASRACGRITSYSFADFDRGFSGKTPEIRATRRLFVRQYGDLRTAFEAQQERCSSYETFRVEDGVVTVETSLEGDEIDEVSAADTCLLIQGSDIADFTPGHRVLAADGDVILTCEARTG